MNPKLNWYQRWQQRCKNPLPHLSTPYRAALEQKQKQWWLAALLGVVLLGYYGYFYVQKQHQAQQLVSVVVAKADVSAPKTLQSDDLTTINLAAELVPKNAYHDPQKVIGQTLRRSLKARQMVLSADLHPQLDPTSVTAHFEQDFAFAVGEDWLAAKLPSVKGGDYVDILASNPQLSADANVVVAENLLVIAVEGQKGRKNLIVNVSQPQAQALLQSRGLRLPMQVLVRSLVTAQADFVPPNSTPANE